MRRPLAQTLGVSAPAPAKQATSAQLLGLAAPPDPRDILNSISAVIYDWDLVTDQLVWGANVHEVLADLAPSALETGNSFADLVAARSESSRFQAIRNSGQRAGEEGAPYRAQYGLVNQAGATIAVEDFGRWFADSAGRPVRAHGVVRIIVGAGRHDLWAEGLATRSKHDPLTGAYMRGHFIEHVNAQCANATRHNSQFAVMIVGVERLGALNQRHGYDVADEVIAAVSRRLHDSVRATDVIARYLGGKFAIVLDSCDAEQCALSARRILRAVSEKPIRASQLDLDVSLKIGAALAPKHGRTAQALLQRAEEAHDFACQSASDGFSIFAPNLLARNAQGRVNAVSDQIIAALNDRRIVLAYQPVVPTKPDRPIYYEALLRIRGVNDELIGPAAILPIAEKVGLIAQIDQRVLELALKRMAAEPDLRIAINASPATVLEPGWIARFAGALALHPGTARRLVLEVTESMAIVDIEATARLLGEVKSLGVRVAMDDFGAGHTSFRGLRGLGVDIVKIDGAFVQNIARSADDRFFVRTLVELARHLEVETVAEWVEDAEAMRILVDWGIDYLQGHHFGRAEVIDAAPSAPLLTASVA